MSTEALFPPTSPLFALACSSLGRLWGRIWSKASVKWIQVMCPDIVLHSTITHLLWIIVIFLDTEPSAAVNSCLSKTSSCGEEQGAVQIFASETLE